MIMIGALSEEVCECEKERESERAKSLLMFVCT